MRLAVLSVALLAGLLGPGVTLAQTPAPETYSGSFWDRPRLTGDWGGFRDRAAKRGVTLDVDWLQTLQGVMSGGVSKNADYWGTFEYTLNVDTGKLGLWPGGFVTAYALSSYGSSAIKDSEALVPVNTAGILPSLAVGKITMGVLDPNGPPLDNSLDHLLQDGVAVAKSIGVTLDLQVVNPALTKTPTGSGGVKNVDTAVIGGLRAFVRF